MSYQPAAYYLIILEGPGKGTPHAVHGAQVTIGRQADNQIVIDRPPDIAPPRPVKLARLRLRPGRLGQRQRHMGERGQGDQRRFVKTGRHRRRESGCEAFIQRSIGCI